jgi:dihydrofolate reductase
MRGVPLSWDRRLGARPDFARPTGQVNFANRRIHGPTRRHPNGRRGAVKLSVFCGISVDGFLARLDHTLDFLPAGEKVPHGFNEFFAGIDVIVFGRNTCEFVKAFGEWPFAGKSVVVLSTRPLDFSWIKAGAIEQMSGDAAVIADRLRARGFQHAYIDGGITVQRFLAAGLIHRMIITRLPVLIGTGIPLFGPVPRDIELRHVATRTFDGGLVQSEYEVLAAGAAGGAR